MRTLGSQAHECLESCHRRLSAVETKDKFIEIILQVFCIDTVVSAVQPGFKIAEDPMNVQGMGFRDGGTRDGSLSWHFWNTLFIDRYQFRFPVPALTVCVRLAALSNAV